MTTQSSSDLNLIQDPETGLALLSKCAGQETPEQERERQFWQLQFMAWRDWRADDVLAVSRALTDGSLFDRPPPFWLLKACSSLCVQCKSWPLRCRTETSSPSPGAFLVRRRRRRPSRGAP